HPDALLGDLYQPIVSLSVGVILFEAGSRLSFSELASGTHRVVRRLILAGGLITWAAVAASVALLFDGVARGVALPLGAVLIVSGPTVVGPLLAFIRPERRVRSLLKWEGVLIDPIGALLGVLVFVGVSSASEGGAVWRPGEVLESLGIGLLAGVAGVAVLWL